MLLKELVGDGGPTPTDVDNQQKFGGNLPAGKYHARLDGAKDVTSEKGSTGAELEFTILAGPHAGKTVKDTLWDSDKDAGKRRQILFAEKLGLLKRSGLKFVPIEGKDCFADARGAEAIIETFEEEYTSKAGKKGKVAKIAFMGIWGLDDPSAGKVVKAKAGDKVPEKKKAIDASEL